MPAPDAGWRRPRAKGRFSGRIRLDACNLPGFADPQRDDRPRYATRDRARQCRLRSANRLSPLTRDLRDRARMAQSIDREKTNKFGGCAHAARIERLTRKLEQFHACCVHVGDDVVRAECQSLTQ